jgi:hypothetical protein
VLAGLVGVGLVLGLTACSDDDDSTPSTTVGRQTEFTAPIPAPTVTIGPAEPATTAATTPTAPTTTPVVTQPVLPTSPPSPPGRTDPVGTPACDAGLLLAVVDAAQGGLPPDTGTEAPICTGGWASMVIGAPQQDRAFAVFVAEPAGWRLVTLGNDAVCTDAAVPAELFGPLGCALWETG